MMWYGWNRKTRCNTALSSRQGLTAGPEFMAASDKHLMLLVCYCSRRSGVLVHQLSHSQACLCIRAQRVIVAT